MFHVYCRDLEELARQKAHLDAIAAAVADPNSPEGGVFARACNRLQELCVDLRLSQDIFNCCCTVRRCTARLQMHLQYLVSRVACVRMAQSTGCSSQDSGVVNL
jgi:hypothetical protein